MTITLSDIAIEVKDNFDPLKEEATLYVGLEHIKPHDLRIAGYGKSSETVSKKYIFKKGDILFGTLRPYFRKVAIAEDDGVCSTELCVIRPRNPALKDLIFCSLANPSFIKFATKRSNGARPRTNWNLISSYVIAPSITKPLTDLAEQISNFGNLIANNAQRIALLEESARLLYFNATRDKKRVSTLMPFSQVAHINPNTPWDLNSSIKYIPMSSISEKHMVVDKNDFEEREKPTSIKFKNGDTLLARITPCLENGKTAYVGFLKDGEVASGSTEFIVLRENLISQYQLYLISRKEDFRALAINSMIGSSGRQRVQKDCFDRYLVAILHPQDAQTLDAQLANIFKQVHLLHSTNEKLAQARDLLLPRLMDGRITL